MSFTPSTLAVETRRADLGTEGVRTAPLARGEVCQQLELFETWTPWEFAEALARAPKLVAWPKPQPKAWGL